MSEKIKSEMISRRGAFSLLGLAAAVSLVVPAAMLTATDADAQTQGMERRDEQAWRPVGTTTERRSNKKKKKPASPSEKK